MALPSKFCVTYFLCEDAAGMDEAALSHRFSSSRAVPNPRMG